MQIRGKAWVFGDGIDTDVLAPGHYMKLPPDELATHCLEAVDPDFAPNVQPGDIVVAGRNFGLGSSREQAAISLKTLGVGAILAQSFARIFYRNALNIGLPAVVLAESAEIAAGDVLSVDPLAGTVSNESRGKNYTVDPLPDHLMAMIADGGLMAHLKKRLEAQKAGKSK